MKTKILILCQLWFEQLFPKTSKRRIIEAHEAGLDYQETAWVLGVKRDTAYFIVRRYMENGVVEAELG